MPVPRDICTASNSNLLAYRAGGLKKPAIFCEISLLHVSFGRRRLKDKPAATQIATVTFARLIRRAAQ
jgi:hypothetical protein